MSYSNTNFIVGLEAAGDIGAFKFVTVDGNDAVDLAGDNEIVLGVGPDYAVAEGVQCPVGGVGNIMQVEAGGTITAAGTRVKSTATGTAVPVATTGTAIQNVAGIALKSASEGDIIPVFVYIDTVRPALT